MLSGICAQGPGFDFPGSATPWSTTSLVRLQSKAPSPVYDLVHIWEQSVHWKQMLDAARVRAWRRSWPSSPRGTAWHLSHGAWGVGAV